MTAPVQFRDSPWTTIVWAAEGIVFVWLGLRLRMVSVRVAGYLVFACVAIRLLAFDTRVDLEDFRPFANERFLAFAVSIGIMYLTALLLYRQRNALVE
jgi:hypothetical protein